MKKTILATLIASTSFGVVAEEASYRVNFDSWDAFYEYVQEDALVEDKIAMVEAWAAHNEIPLTFGVEDGDVVVYIKEGKKGQKEINLSAIHRGDTDDRTTKDLEQLQNLKDFVIEHGEYLEKLPEGINPPVEEITIDNKIEAFNAAMEKAGHKVMIYRDDNGNAVLIREGHDPVGLDTDNAQDFIDALRSNAKGNGVKEAFKIAIKNEGEKNGYERVKQIARDNNFERIKQEARELAEENNYVRIKQAAREIAEDNNYERAKEYARNNNGDLIVEPIEPEQPIDNPPHVDPIEGEQPAPAPIEDTPVIEPDNETVKEAVQELVESGQNLTAYQAQQAEIYATTYASQQQQIDANKQDIATLFGEVDRLDEKMDGVMAGVHAVNNARPYLSSEGDTAIGAGVGYAGDAGAVAFGAAHAFTDSLSASMTLNVTTGSYSEVSGGAGVQYKF
ncbi:YadA C-terminal domain-containing protein [Vibrio hepatarius]|uniref:YadA C-terminal domain-containing protein n=1 Tax=Vibrio hepatarius TaxID=171383 RepID=UPI003736F251